MLQNIDERGLEPDEYDSSSSRSSAASSYLAGVHRPSTDSLASDAAPPLRRNASAGRVDERAGVGLTVGGGGRAKIAELRRRKTESALHRADGMG